MLFSPLSVLAPATVPLDASTPDLPRFTATSFFTAWGIDPVPFIICVWAASLYLVGVQVLRRRGDHWPLGRTLAFVVGGMGSFYVVTSSGIGASRKRV